IEGERQFGLFGPVQPAQAEAHDTAKERETKVADWINMAEHRGAGAGKSTYEYRMEKWRKTHDAAWRIYYIDNAVRPYKSSYVELMASLNPKGPCNLFLGFAA